MFRALGVELAVKKPISDQDLIIFFSSPFFQGFLLGADLSRLSSTWHSGLSIGVHAGQEEPFRHPRTAFSSPCYVLLLDLSRFLWIQVYYFFAGLGSFRLFILQWRLG